MSQRRKKPSTQFNPEIRSAIRAIAETEGLQRGALADEAFADLMENRRNTKTRRLVISAHLASLEQYGVLSTELAE